MFHHSFHPQRLKSIEPRRRPPILILEQMRRGRQNIHCLLLGLEVVEEDRALLGLLTPILDNDARAVNDLAGVTLTVNLA